MTQHDDEHEHDEHGSHGNNTATFIAVFVALCVLTAISFAAGSSESIMRNPAIGWTIMMAVSCAKALLVMLFFMHLLWEANWKYVLTIPASIMSLFLLLMLFPDILGRTEHYSNQRWLHAATPHEDHDQHGEEDDEAHHDSESH